eukprot:TRINITY_DN10308_c0_g1_i1.p1 TRINITY_DN10308_c0_g1~~TRINITY_DN10308_c0_g1_i1.p1  ORF type:complete len:459 (+),score=48.46 TRINITY_DN10308_c0_g1_i1:27-1379(+)
MDHQRPLWTTTYTDDDLNKHVAIIVEAFHPKFPEAQELMEMIAEPRSRTSRIHVFELTEDSLYTAVSLGMVGPEIVRRLCHLSKTTVAEEIIDYVNRLTSKSGLIKLVLDNKRILVSLPRTNRLVGSVYLEAENWCTRHTLTNYIEMATEVESSILSDKMVQNEYLIHDTVEPGPGKTTIFEVRSDASLIEMKRYFKEVLQYPLDCVYAFNSDVGTPSVDFRLKSTARLRPYQSLTLSKTLGSGRARSGLIVLPCGAGKTLVGCSTAALIRKPTIVVCMNSLTVMQWWQQFRLWTDIPMDRLSVFTAGKKDPIRDIVITTYNILAMEDSKRAAGSTELINALRDREWGLMLMDEVHVAAASTFRRLLNNVRAHCIIGLTATLLREDDKITDLLYLVGPKLYEANWKELSSKGYLADVTCIEVMCPLKGIFVDAVLQEGEKKSTRTSVLHF